MVLSGTNNKICQQIIRCCRACPGALNWIQSCVMRPLKKEHRTALITGATRGIGRETSRLLCQQGFTVFATGRDETRLSSLKEETGCAGSVCDLADPRSVAALYAEASARIGPIDLLINNAGFNPGKTAIDNLSTEAMDASYAVNFRAPFLLCREALRDMGCRRTGHILNVISTIARTSAENYSAYCSQKTALHAFTLCLIKEARKVNVKVTGIYPGGTDTEFRPEERPDYMSAASAAQMILHAVNAPDDVVVHELVYRPIVETNF